MATFSFPENGGTATMTLPEAVGRLGFWVKPSPIPDTPPWEWVITNIPAAPLYGLVNGYTDSEAAAYAAVRAALTFWRARGYETVDLPVEES